MYINRPKKSWIGGDYIQMERTSEELRNLGVEVDIEETPLPKPALKMFLYDIVHIWNFSMPWAKMAVWAAKSKKLKAVCSMIYHESDSFVKYPEQQIMLDQLDGLIFLTEGEKDRVRRNLKLDESKSYIVRNGIDKMWFDPNYHLGSYLLTVGRIEPSKGQLAVARVANKLGMKYLCVGEQSDKSYAKMVELEGAELVGTKTPDELKEIYKNCSIYVLASRAEVMPLTVMEAGAQGKPVVLTDHCEWKIPVEYCEWANEKSIELAILRTGGENKELRNILKEMTWQNVAKEIKQIYESIQ